MTDYRVYDTSYSYTRTEYFYNDLGDLDGDAKADVIVASKEQHFTDCRKFLEYVKTMRPDFQQGIQQNESGHNTMHVRYQVCRKNPDSHYREPYRDRGGEAKLVDVLLSRGGTFDRKAAPFKVADGMFDPGKGSLLYEDNKLDFFDDRTIRSPVQFIEWGAVLDEEEEVHLAGVVRGIPSPDNPFMDLARLPHRVAVSDLYLKAAPSNETKLDEESTDHSNSRLIFAARQGLKIPKEGALMSAPRLALGQNIQVVGSSSRQWLYRGYLGGSWGDRQLQLESGALIGFRQNLDPKGFYAAEMGLGGGLSLYVEEETAAGIMGESYILIHFGPLGTFGAASLDSARPNHSLSLMFGLSSEADL